jgi:hypothetical protein
MTALIVVGSMPYVAKPSACAGAEPPSDGISWLESLVAEPVDHVPAGSAAPRFLLSGLSSGPLRRAGLLSFKVS